MQQPLVDLTDLQGPCHLIIPTFLFSTPTAPDPPRWFPIQVLSSPNPVQLPRSDGIGLVQGGMAIDWMSFRYLKFLIFLIQLQPQPSSSQLTANLSFQLLRQNTLKSSLIFSKLSENTGGTISKCIQNLDITRYISLSPHYHHHLSHLQGLLTSLCALILTPHSPASTQKPEYSS